MVNFFFMLCPPKEKIMIPSLACLVYILTLCFILKKKKKLNLDSNFTHLQNKRKITKPFANHLQSYAV